MPPGTPQRNGVSECHSRTLFDVVQSMMSLIDLPLSFWCYALETNAFTLNTASSKSVKTTAYELWFGKKPKLSFLKVWGCDTCRISGSGKTLKVRTLGCARRSLPHRSRPHTLRDF